MTDQEDNNNLGINVSEDNHQERKPWACLGQTCSRLLIVFLSQFLSFFDHLWLLLENLRFEKRVTNQLFVLEFCAFYLHQDYEQGNFFKKSSLYYIGWSLRNWKKVAYLQLAKNWNISFKT